MDDPLPVLTRFYHEFVRPDTELVVERLDHLDRRLDTFEDRTLSHFDAIYKRLDDLRDEYAAVEAAVARIERRETPNARQELDAIKAQIADLQQRVANFEAEL